MLTTAPGPDIEPNQDRPVVVLRPQNGAVALSDKARERTVEALAVGLFVRWDGEDRERL